MKQFNLEEYLKDPQRKVITRSGNPVRIICTDANSEHCVVGLVCSPLESEEDAAVSYYANGTRWTNFDCEDDLFFVTKKHEGWINIFKNKNGLFVIPGVGICETKELAAEMATEIKKDIASFVATIKIEWEEDSI